MAEYVGHTDVHVLTGQIMKSSGDKFCRGLSANKSSGRQIVTIQIILSTMSTASRQSHDGVVRLPLDESIRQIKHLTKINNQKYLSTILYTGGTGVMNCEI